MISLNEVQEVILFVASILLSGFYSGSEAALVSISVDRTKQLIEEGGRKGAALKFLSEKPSEVLTTILVGNNVVNIFAASFTTSIAQRYFENDAVAISVGVTTLFVLVFGEIIPKTFARTRAEQLAFPIIRILQVNYILLWPVVTIFRWIIQTVLGKNVHPRGRVVTRHDIEFMVNKADQEKTMDSKQIDLLTSILEFPTIKVKDIMIPRDQVKFVRIDQSVEDIINVSRDENHSRYPVADETLDNVLGFLHIKDIAFMNDAEKVDFDIKKYVKAPFFVYEHMKIQAVFDHMNRKKVHLALVKDENGLVVGIVTLEDIIEEVLGEIHDEHDDDDDTEKNAPIKEDKEGIVVNARMSLRDLYNEYDIKIPLNDNYSTLSGFILDILGNNFPKQGNIIVWDGYSFELTKVESLEIKEVKISDPEGEKHIFSRKDGQEDDRSKNDTKG